MIVKILSCKNKPFTGDDGEQINYFWVKAENIAGYVIQFGSSNDYSSKIGEKLDLPIESSVGADGKPRLKEVKL